MCSQRPSRSRGGAWVYKLASRRCRMRRKRVVVRMLRACNAKSKELLRQPDPTRPMHELILPGIHKRPVPSGTGPYRVTAFTGAGAATVVARDRRASRESMNFANLRPLLSGFSATSMIRNKAYLAKRG